MDDQELIAAYADAQDQQAFAELVRRHGGWLYAGPGGNCGMANWPRIARRPSSFSSAGGRESFAATPT